MNVFLLIQALVATAPALAPHNCDTGYSTAKEYAEHCEVKGDEVVEVIADGDIKNIP